MNEISIKKILKTSGILLLMILWPSLIFFIFNVDASTVSDKNYVIYYTISNISLMVILISIYRKDLIKNFRSYFKNLSANMEVSLKYWLAGFAVMYVSNLIITFVLNKELAGNEMDVRKLLSAMPILMTFNAVICAPVNEELVFRKSFKDIFPNKYVFATMSGLIFGMMHIAGYITSFSDLVYLIPYGALGFTFGLLYYRTDNIFSTITMHSIHNLLATVISLIGASL